MSLDWIEPDWPASNRVRALATARRGGVSRGPYASLNLGSHVGDDPTAVQSNRDLLVRELELPSEPLWLNQVHGCDVVRTEAGTGHGCTADAAVSVEPGRICAVLSADCLPVLLCDRAGTQVAAVHAGWRGLLHGVIEAALDSLAVSGPDVLCWLGPAIGPQAFEVGDEVRAAFVKRAPAAVAAFQPSPTGRWLADIYVLARQRLEARYVGFVGGGGWCTVTDSSRFFSYRRDTVTGRMASLIWIEP
jgi:YfiH family protein